jgi:dTDP-4-amino-4,6-dideoxygalactose transaminase
MFSFHATKVFYSIEGGMLTFRDPEYRRLFDYLKNFDFESETEVVMPGTNAKMNEFQALMGLLLLRRLDEMVEKRRAINARYRERLDLIPGIRLVAQPADTVRYNYAYMPVKVDEEEFGLTRDQLYLKLREYNVFARRYFYPLVPDFASYRGLVASGNLPVARRAASRILTLPIYSDLALDDVDRICDMIQHIQSEADRGTAVVNESEHAKSELALRGAQS